MGQGHPEGQQFLLSPPVLPFLLLCLPPHLLLCLLVAVLMPCMSLTTLEPLPHFDQENAGMSCPGCLGFEGALMVSVKSEPFDCCVSARVSL